MTQIPSTFDVVVPRIRRKVEPLCAVYSNNCLAPILELLQQNELKIYKLFDTVNVKYIAEAKINSFDPEHLSFFNINSPADLERARRLAIEKR
jgi:molybdopterin-guanine dinucleotide biosynthesis protein A